MKPLLSQEETDALIARAQAGDIEARNAVVMDNQGLVHMHALKVIKTKWGRRLDYDDVLGFGQIAIIQAVEKYNPAEGVKFCTYAYYCVFGAMRNRIKDTSTLVRIPRSHHDIRDKIKRIDPFGQMGDADVAEKLKLAPETVASIRRVPGRSLPETWLPCDERRGPDQNAASRELSTKVANYLKRLPPRTRDAIWTTLETEDSSYAVAQKHGVSGTRIRQIKKDAIKKMQHDFKDAVA